MNRQYGPTTSPVTGHWALNDDQDHAIVNGNLTDLIDNHLTKPINLNLN